MIYYIHRFMQIQSFFEVVLLTVSMYFAIRVEKPLYPEQKAALSLQTVPLFVRLSHDDCVERAFGIRCLICHKDQF